MNRKVFALALAITICASLSSPGVGLYAISSAQAQDTAARSHTEAARFSDKGRTLVGGSVGGYWSSSGPTTPDGWSVWLQPSVGYFLRDRIGLGLTPGYTTGADATNLRYHEASLAVFAIVDLPLAARLSLLVLPSFGYARRWRDARPPLGIAPSSSPDAPVSGFSAWSSERKTDSLRAELDLPVAYHLSDSLVVGLGPFVRYEYLFGQQSAASASANVGGPNFVSPFTPTRNRVHIGMQSFIGVSF